jgi:hypothetical protein
MFQEALLFVKTDRVDGKAGLARHLPDLKRLRHLGSEYTLELSPESSGLRRQFEGW